MPMVDTSPTDVGGGCVGLDSDTRLPQSQALKTLKDVLSWRQSKQQQLCSSYSHTKGFVRPTETTRTKPYTLVCHDFKGGYLEDRYLQGGKKKDAYFFSRWELIDIFVYFSHHFVTVPPIGWIRASHKHGTMMLGTIITEWKEGAALWSDVLSSKDTMQKLIQNLVAICTFHGFDGWLVNVENKIDEYHVEALTEFVRLLTEESHQQLPGSKVLWYDSVIRSGELKWQDELNNENCQFFDVCDGIFLNYCWTPEKLAASKDYAATKNRPYDVFVGIDVFGRGCPGGGGFNTREALQQVRKQSLSAAIFAPGWVLECLGPTDFENNDSRFWANLLDLCYPTVVSGLPLSSAFCQGHGDDFFSMGKGTTGQSWFNMSLQQRQPELAGVYRILDQTSQPSAKTSLSSAYYGGCSLELSAHLTRPLQTLTFRLFSVKARLDGALHCSYTYKENSSSPCDIHLVLAFGSGLHTRRAFMVPSESHVAHCDRILSIDDAEGGEHIGTEPDLDRICSHDDRILPAGGASPVPPTETRCLKIANKDGSDETVYLCPLTAEELEPLKTMLWFHDLQEGEGVQDHRGWKTRHFKLDTSKLGSGNDNEQEDKIFSVSITLCRPQDARPDQSQCTEDDHDNAYNERTSILLGHLQVFSQEDLTLPAPSVSNIRLDILLTPSCSGTVLGDDNDASADPTADKEFCPAIYTLQWDMEAEAGVDYFNIYFTTNDPSMSACLAGHSLGPLFITAIADNFLCNGKVGVTVQPVLTATGLPLPMSKCANAKINLPKLS